MRLPPPTPRFLFVSGSTLLALVLFGYAVSRLLEHGRPAPSATAAATTAPVPVIPTTPPGFAFVRVDVDTSSPLVATVRWETTEPSTASIVWGPTGMQPLLWRTAAQPMAVHTMRFDGLGLDKAYRVAITATNADGKVLDRTIDFTSSGAPGSVAASVSNGVVRVNGGAFFPFVTWQECPDRWTTEIAGGISLFAGNPCTGIDSLISGLDGRALATGTSDDAAPSTSSSVIGWFYPDEADGRGLDATTLPAAGPGLRFLTLTNHFWSGAAPLPQGRGIYPGLLALGDVIGFDLYPLQEYCRPDLLPGVFDSQRELTQLAPGKATFQWIEVRAMKCPTSGVTEITPATIRAESWLAIAGGANGLGFFPSDWGDEVNATIGHVAARVAQIEPALLQPVVPVAADAGAVRASARELDGALYVIAVNAGLQRAPVKLTAPQLGDRTVTIAGSTRTLTAADGTLTDSLPPLGVRIYASAP